MSTFYLPPAAAASVAGTSIERRGTATDSEAPVDEEAEFRRALEESDPQWFAMGIEKNNAALFQAACIPYRRKLSDVMRQSLQDHQREVSDSEFSLIVDCLVDVAFSAAKEHQENWHSFSHYDRIKWISQFADEAIERYDSL